MPSHPFVPAKMTSDPSLDLALGTARVDIPAFREEECPQLAHRETHIGIQSNVKLVGPMHNRG
jgi:hypothetical protein